MDWRAIPSLSSLRAFEATARLLSFSEAARELNVTHAAISQHVRALEAEFVESLVARQGRGLVLTSAGLRLADSLRTGFGEIEQGVKTLREHRDTRPLHVSLTPAFATNWLMPRIGDFWQKHPDIQVNINPGIEFADMVQDSVDLCIRYGEGKWPGVEAEKLTDGDFLVVARPDLVADIEVNCLQDIQHLPWLMEDHMMERIAIVEKEGIDLTRTKVTLLATNALVLSGVASGLGITVQPRSLVEREIETGAFVSLCKLNQSNLAYYLVTLPDRKTAALMTFVKWLKSFNES